MIDRWFKTLLMNTICLCAKGLFKYVAIYVPDKEKDNVEAVVFGNDEKYIEHMCKYKGAKKS